MATQVYTFHVSYEGLEKIIWRKIEVSSNYRLDKLGYLILASFDTMAYHLFEFYYNDLRFAIPDDESLYEQIDMADYKLYQLNLNVGDCIQMDYDFGTTQTFLLKLVKIEDMERGQSRRYPYIIEGAGRGIIDDFSCEELTELIEQINLNDKTNEPIYYKDEDRPWDYRLFDIKQMNKFLKREIKYIEEGYSQFWN